MDEPAVVLDGIDLTGGGAVVRVAVVGEGMPAGGDPLAEGGQVIGRQAEGEEVEAACCWISSRMGPASARTFQPLSMEESFDLGRGRRGP